MSFINAIASWRPRTRFYYGWLVLGTAALGTFAATGIAQVVLGGIQSLIFEDMRWDRSTIAVAVTAGTWSAGLLTPVVGRLADRHGPRALMAAAAVIVGLCYFALSGIGAVWHFYAAYIVARSIANPNLIGVVPRTPTVNFFRRRRNFALGLTSMARPVGGAINIQLISLIAHFYSWRVAYRFLGGFALVLSVPLFLIMRWRPEDIGLQPDGVEGWPAGHVSGAAAHSADSPSDGEGFHWRAGEAAQTPTFWLTVAAETMIILTSGAISFQVVPYLVDSGLSFVVAAGAMSLSSLLGAFVNPGWGLLSDRFSARRLALVALAVSTAVTSLFLVVDSGRQSFFLVIIWGTASGGLTILGSMMIAQYFGRGSYGAITGLMGPFQTGGLGLGPTFGAMLFRATGGYTTLFVSALAAYACAIALIYIARPPRLPRRAQVEAQAAND